MILPRAMIQNGRPEVWSESVAEGAASRSTAGSDGEPPAGMPREKVMFVLCGIANEITGTVDALRWN